MASFKKYAPKLKRFEGGFCNIPEDLGGATMCGVTIATFRKYYGQERTVDDLKNITDEQWTNIMKTGYWDACKCDMIQNQCVAELIADWCVNSGRGIIKKVQGIICVDRDGVVGPQTLNAINSWDPQRLHSCIKQARKTHYEAIVERDPRQRKFLKGWMNRLNTFTFEY